MELELSNWFVQHNRLGSCYVEGEIERETEKAILFQGKAIIKPSTICCKCGKMLTDPVSMEIGIGPICLGEDLRGTMSQEEKDAYLAKYSQEHLIRTWIPKSVIKNREVLQTKQVTNTEQEFDVQIIVHKEYILVKTIRLYGYLCKTVAGYKWNPEKLFWSFPKSAHTADSLIKAFEFIENKKVSQEVIDLAESLREKQQIKSSEELPDIPNTVKQPWLHQKQAFWFSRDLKGAGLLFDMGCGKTKTAIDLIINGDDEKVLIICPNTVVRVWPKEFEKHSHGEFEVVPCEISKKQISVEDKTAIARNAYERYGKVAVVVNYESAWRNSMGEFIKSVHWDRIILDESHKAKQPDGKLGKFVGQLGIDTYSSSTKRNILTGTLMPHSPMDVFNQYLFLDYTVFGKSFYKFRSRYARMGGYMGKQIVGYQNLDELAEKIYSIAYRVTAEDALSLPDENHIVRDFDLNAEAEYYYRQAVNDMYISMGEDRVDMDIVLVQMLRMQQITSGYLPIMREIELDNGKTKKVLDRVEKIDSGKAELLEEIIEDISEKEPVIVFCRFQHDLDEIKTVAEKLGRKYGEISGRSKDGLDEKAELADGIQVCGVQIQAGGVGIDLTKSRYGIYYSVGYSLGDYLQSLARIHRPGQTRPVIYYHLVASGTIDETVYAGLRNKEDVIKLVIERKVEL